MHQLLLDLSPQPRNEQLVAPAALAVHRDADAVIRDQPGDDGGREQDNFTDHRNTKLLNGF